jgi:predicted DNA-binding transcriptional regulator YafY
LLSILHAEGKALCFHDIEDLLIKQGLISYDNISSKTIERKLEEMCSSLGLLERETIKRSKYYSVAKDIFETLDDNEVTELAAAVSLYKNIIYPVTAGYYCERSLIDYLTYERGVKYISKDYFQYKSLHFHPVIEEQILWKILNAINKRQLISLDYKLPLNKRKSGSSLKQLLKPYKIRYDIQCGRFYLVSYDNRDKCIISRLDRIEDVEVSKSTYERDNLPEFYERDLKNSWSSVPLGEGYKTEKVELEINIDEPKENYIIEQIKGEVQDSDIEKVGKGRYRLSMQVNDSGEMVPWIRGYSGYIKVIKGRNLARRVAEDWKEMLKTYGAF